jgi:tetratricopeptide (TPR) repeat protein
VRALMFMIFGTVLLVPALCPAGVYDPADFLHGPEPGGQGSHALPYTQFQALLRDLISVNRSGSERQRSFAARRDGLLEKVRHGSATIDERIELSACLIRLRQYDEAISVLMPLSRERSNFMVYANLGTAEQLAGRLDRALSSLQQVRDVWPSEWPGVSKTRLEWYREVEGYQSRLVRRRYAEAVRSGGGRSQQPQKLDDLFGDGKEPVRYVGESGQYEVGAMAARERSKLPSDAIAIVQQLLLWMPEDTRLYWQLGELYNAAGDTDAARRIFEDCVDNRRFEAPELRAHRQIVRESAPKAGPLLLEPEVEAPTTASESPAAADWLPNTGKLIAVGGVAAAVVMILLYLQVRELRRRRRAS